LPEAPCQLFVLFPSIETSRSEVPSENAIHRPEGENAGPRIAAPDARAISEPSDRFRTQSVPPCSQASVPRELAFTFVQETTAAAALKRNVLRSMLF
jgi:hypothetical protein